MSGNINKSEQSLKIPCILFTFLEFHFEISGNEFKDEHPENKYDIFSRF